MKKIILCLALLLLPIPSVQASFKDVSTNHENAEAIDYIQSENIVNGYLDGTFKPDQQISRAEFTKIIIGSKYDQSEINSCTPDIKFSDIDPFQVPWIYQYTCMARNKGVINGYTDGTFKPYQNISFIEAAKIIVNTFGYEVVADDLWYKPFVEKLAENKAIPTSINTFQKNITRGEMAEMIYRLKAKNLNKTSLTFLDLDLNSLKVYLDKNTNVWIQYDKNNRKQLTSNAGVTNVCKNKEPLKYSYPQISGDLKYVLITVICSNESSEIYIKRVDTLDSKKVGDGIEAVFIYQGNELRIQVLNPKQGEIPKDKNGNTYDKNFYRYDGGNYTIYENPFLSTDSLDNRKLLTIDDRKNNPNFLNCHDTQAKYPNYDPANEFISYTNLEKKISFKVPYNKNWGTYEYKINPYDYDAESNSIEFGPVNCEGRPYKLSFEDALSLELLSSKITQPDQYGNTPEKPTVSDINGLKVVKQSVIGMCADRSIWVIGKDYNYNFYAKCASDDSILDKLIESISLLS